MLSILKAARMIQAENDSSAERTRQKRIFDMKRCQYLLLITLATCLNAAYAQEENTGEDPAAPPPLPPKLTDEQVEPSVVIRKEEDKLIEEYSLNGQVYMVKVTPAIGPPYYYLDEDGDGQLVLQPGDEGMNPVRPVYWKVKEWK